MDVVEAEAPAVVDEPAPRQPAGADHVLAVVYRQHAGRLVGLARLLLDDPRQAEEVVQEAFARTYAGWSRVKQQDDPLPYGGPGAAHTAVPLALSPDGSRIAVGAFEGQSYQAIAILDSTTLGSLVVLDLALPADDATYVPDGRLVVALIDESNSRRRLATFDETGAETGTLLETAPTGVTRIGSDASGQLLLHFGGDDLQRWREGDATPTRIARGVHDAAWIPKVDAAPAPSTTMPPVTIPGPAPLPASILAARGAHELVEIASIDGSVTRTIPSNTVFGGATFSLRNDGEALLLGDTNGNSCGRTMGQSGGVSVVDTATWKRESIRLPEDVRTAMSATWKPDGSAYAFVQLDCEEASQLVVSPRDGGPVRVFDLSANGEPASGMIAGWDLDGRHLALLVGRTGEPEIEHWIVDTASTGDEVEYSIVPWAEGILLAPLGSTGRWLVVEEADGSVPRIAELDVTTGAIGRTLFTWDGLPPDEIVHRVSCDPSGRHLLLLAARNGGPGPTLYRWSEGDSEPTKLAERVDAAAWRLG